MANALDNQYIKAQNQLQEALAHAKNKASQVEKSAVPIDQINSDEMPNYTLYIDTIAVENGEVVIYMNDILPLHPNLRNGWIALIPVTNAEKKVLYWYCETNIHYRHGSLNFNVVGSLSAPFEGCIQVEENL